MKQLEIIPKIKKLCKEHKYDEAANLANEIEFTDISTKALLLIAQHEKNFLTTATMGK